MMKEIVIDAKDKIAGRLASFVAKELLKGNKVIVLNVEKAIISGDKEDIIEEFKRKRERGDPYKGPFYPKYPDEIFRRMVRGMLPYKKHRGKIALKNLKIFYGIPEEYKDKILNIKIKSSEDLKRASYMSLEEISILLGAKKRW
ncbi:MAG: 50S ribosomal protein L13 [Candidatus Aenigmatarchaeota archaeon]